MEAVNRWVWQDVLFFMLMAVLMSAFISWAVTAHHERRDRCESKGGEWYQAGASYICLAPDGRIIR